MFARRAAMSALLLMSLPVAAADAQAAASSGCWRGDEIAAVRIQDLQTMLMVDALKCRTTLPAGLDSYNSFMTEKRELVSRSRRMVQSHFVREYGSEGMARSTDYETRRTNETSLPIVNVHACDRVAAFSRIASHASDDDLLILSEAVARSAAVEACPVPVDGPKPAGMVIEVWNRPAALAIAPAQQPPVAVLTPAVAETGEGPAAAATASNADAVKALQAAVLALSQVAATLQPKPVETAAAPR